MHLFWFSPHAVAFWLAIERWLAMSTCLQIIAVRRTESQTLVASCLSGTILAQKAHLQIDVVRSIITWVNAVY